MSTPRSRKDGKGNARIDMVPLHIYAGIYTVKDGLAADTAVRPGLFEMDSLRLTKTRPQFVASASAIYLFVGHRVSLYSNTSPSTIYMPLEFDVVDSAVSFLPLSFLSID